MIDYFHTISVEEYNFLRKSVGWKEIQSEQAQKGLDHSSYLVTAVDREETVGLARLVSDSGYIAVIVDVIVLPEYQRQGIGKSLMQKVLDYIKRNLEDGQSVLINLMAAKGKEPFYSQFGFEKRPTEDQGCGMTQWIGNISSK